MRTILFYLADILGQIYPAHADTGDLIDFQWVSVFARSTIGHVAYLFLLIVPFSFLHPLRGAVTASEGSPISGSVPPAGALIAAPRALPRFYIQEFQVQGNDHLISQIDFENAVYPFLGPYRDADDVEQARSALEKVYRDKGYATVAVSIPPQPTNTGVISLQVSSNPVGRLRIKGSRYFSLDEIRRETPSLSEGTVPNFNQVNKDLVILNQLPDRRITPSLEPGMVPGTVDVNLQVKDTPPLHGSLELNNRFSADTRELRLNGSVSYDNLWQLGHSIGASFQVGPENIGEVEVFSGFYQARLPGVSWLSLILQGTDQNSNVSTLGGIGVSGKGGTIGGRAVITLPGASDFFESVSLGFDWKHFEQGINLVGEVVKTPVTYYPFSAAYSGTWIEKSGETDFNAGITAAAREIGSTDQEFELNRHGATGDFIYIRGDLSRTQNLPEDVQLFGKIQGQASGQPLVNTEQFSGGGLGTVRGYLESEALGDNGLLGTAEVRSPSLRGVLGKAVDEWRFYIFGDGGFLTISDPLPEQASRFNLASTGVGTRIKLLNHLNGSLDIGVPLIAGPDTPAYLARFTFRLWADF